MAPQGAAGDKWLHCEGDTDVITETSLGPGFFDFTNTYLWLRRSIKMLMAKVLNDHSLLR